MNEVPVYVLTMLSVIKRWVLHTKRGKAFAIYFLLLVNGFVPLLVTTLFAITFVVYLAWELRDTRKRKICEEYIDMGPIKADYTMAEYHETMTQIGQVSELTASQFSILSHAGFGGLPFVPNSILDVGCGAGWLSYKLQDRYPDCDITGIEINDEAIKFAAKQAHKNKKTPTFRLIEHPDLREPDKSVDVITCSLVVHHIPTEEDIIELLRRCGKVARKAIIISDLERNGLSTIMFRHVMAPLFNNKITKHDGELSVRRSFTETEYKSFLTKAGYKPNQYTINWRPVNWFIITILL